jgi:hypothetical protein
MMSPSASSGIGGAVGVDGRGDDEPLSPLPEHAPTNASASTATTTFKCRIVGGGR